MPNQRSQLAKGIARPNRNNNSGGSIKYFTERLFELFQVSGEYGKYFSPKIGLGKVRFENKRNRRIFNRG
ncbi:MAG: hypothetical protein H6629_06030 [Calditrichae bacterium]|nr:hypothetical protein [Calditrichia bacterium]